MGVAGSLTYDTKLDTKGFQKGVNDITNKAKTGGTTVKNIVAGLGITKIISKAFQVISSSVDSAISRIDTLKNFPKVMSNLGIGSEDATKSINKLSEKLKGIPTKLDDAALAVQRFTSANGDIEKSTDIFLAVNNAILAGGASADIQASALEQLSQAYAKGKPDMVEWRTLQTAMPAQLKQVADAMGTTSDALGEGLRTGTISMDEFIDKIVEMNKEGVNGFTSFEEQAKNATGGINTSITNMKTAVVRGVGNIITSFDKLLKKNNLGGIASIVSNIGKTSEKVLSNIGKQIEKLNISKLVDTLKKLVPIIGSVVAGFVAYNTVLNVINGINIVKNILSATSALIGLTSATNLSAGAMAIFNTIMSANPIGLAVAGITALIGVLVLSKKMFGDEKDQIEKNNDALNNYKNEMKNVEKAKNDYIKSNMSEIQNYQNLANELDNLVDENGKVKDGYEERAKFIVGTLNDALGTEIKLNNGVIEGYNGVRDAITDVIKQKRAKVMLDAHEQEYNKAIEKQADLEKLVTSAMKEQKDARKELNSWVSETAKQYGLTNDELLELMNTNDVFNSKLPVSGNELVNLQAKYTGLNGEIKRADQSLKDTQKTYDDNQLKIIDYELALQGFKDKNYEIVSQIYQDTVNYQGKTNADKYAKYQEGIATAQEYLDRLKQNQDKYSVEEYNALVSAGEAKLNELIKQQEKYKTAIDEGGKKRVASTKKITADELLAMQDKTIEFKKTGDGHVQAYVDGQRYKAPMAKKDAEKLGKDIAKEIDKAKMDSKKAGENIISGTQQGINNRSLQNSVFNSIASFGNSLLSTLKKSLKEHSPSRASREYGQFLLQGLNLGVDDEKKSVLDNIDSFGEDVLNRMENAVNIETGKMSFSGTSGSVTQILNANSSFTGNINNVLELDGEVVYNNQQKITARKNLQRGGVR